MHERRNRPLSGSDQTDVGENEVPLLRLRSTGW